VGLKQREMEKQWQLLAKLQWKLLTELATVE
jgi:hypothetical protein